MKYIIIGIILTALGIVYILISNNYFKTVCYKITSEKLKFKNGKHKFILLADLHNHIYGKNNKRLIQAIHKQNPEFIIVAGDLLIAKPGYRLDIALDFMKELSKTYPIYYGNGNHEYRLRIYPEKYGTMYEEYTEKIKKMGIHLLENKKERIFIDGAEISIFGLEIDKKFYHRFSYHNFKKDYMEELLGRTSNSEFNLLIAHNPSFFHEYEKWGADLTCSGHVHGGVMRLPVLGGVISPQLRFFPEYDGGIFERNGRFMVLSRGLGMHTIPIRIFNPAELVVVELCPPK